MVEYKNMQMPDISHLIDCKFLGNGDIEFRAFIDRMPSTHWSRYDLSAVRLGWEAHKHLSEIAALEQNPIHKALMDAEKTTEVKYRNMPELKLLPTEEDLVRKDMIIEQLQNKLDNLADELDKFLASKGSALSTRAIASAWIRGQYDND